MMAERTALYRIWGSADLLLYIGISKDFGARWKQHAKQQPWWDEMKRLRAEAGRPSSLPSSSIPSSGSHTLGSMSPAPVTAVRITVALIPKAAAAFDRLRERTRLSKTDLVNRAISLYEFIDGEMAAGREILVRDTDGLVQLVKLL